MLYVELSTTEGRSGAHVVRCGESEKEALCVAMNWWVKSADEGDIYPVWAYSTIY